MYKRLLLGLVVFLLVVGGIVGARYFIARPAQGVLSTELSQRAAEYVPAQVAQSTTQSAEVECFSIAFPLPVANLKTETTSTEVSTKCVVRGTIEKPRAQFTISAQAATTLLQISDEPGVQLRLQKEEEYSSIEVPQLAGYEYAAFRTDTELIAFWIDDAILYIVSLHDAARISEELAKFHTQLIEQVLVSVSRS